MVYFKENIIFKVPEGVQHLPRSGGSNYFSMGWGGGVDNC